MCCVLSNCIALGKQGGIYPLGWPFSLLCQDINSSHEWLSSAILTKGHPTAITSSTLNELCMTVQIKCVTHSILSNSARITICMIPFSVCTLRSVKSLGEAQIGAVIALLTYIIYMIFPVHHVWYTFGLISTENCSSNTQTQTESGISFHFLNPSWSEVQASVP